MARSSPDSHATCRAPLSRPLPNCLWRSMAEGRTFPAPKWIACNRSRQFQLNLLRTRIEARDAEAADLPRPCRLRFRSAARLPAFPFGLQDGGQRGEVGLGLCRRCLLRGTLSLDPARALNPFAQFH